MLGGDAAKVERLRTKVPGHVCHARKGGSNPGTTEGSLASLRIYLGCCGRLRESVRCEGDITLGRAPFVFLSLSVAENLGGRATTHPTNGDFISRGNSFIHNGTCMNPQFVGHICVSVLDGADDKVLIILCVHRLQIGFLFCVEDKSGKGLNYLQEPIQGLTCDHPLGISVGGDSSPVRSTHSGLQ